VVPRPECGFQRGRQMRDKVIVGFASLGVLCLLTVLFAETSHSHVLTEQESHAVLGSDGTQSRWRICQESAKQNWCETTAQPAGTPCVAGVCGNCTKCSFSPGQITLERCNQAETQHTCPPQTPPDTHNCGDLRDGTCGATGCTSGWASCAIGGTSVGTCADSLVVKGCDP